ITQVYKNHFGQTATRQSWDDGKVYNNWNVPYDSAINKPTAADVGAITKTDADNHYVRQGSSGVVYQGDELPWNSPTGAYLKDNGPHSSLIWHMGLNSGSASAAQFYFDFANGGIKYRSSRDNSGFEKPWARIYTDQDKPTAAEIGALSLNELVGIPMPWPQATAPSGWLKCNGQTFDKNVYPLLAQAYPAGVLPDLRGEFIRGWDDGRQIDSGRTILSLQLDLFKSHYHALQYIGFDNSNNVNGTSGSPLRYASGDDPGYSNYNIDSLVGGAETRPRNIAFNYIVRAA
ncbi:phage tail protein, partial [Pectobacterium brasiliense]|uniref:phage tail protein n=1 Tax=Pectobacterium brasiliense TaxID=180957 RepID=UPI0032EED270